MMEGYYHQVLHSKDAQDFPIIVIEGMTHMQFASGSPPPLVFAKDLNPEVHFPFFSFSLSPFLSLFLSLPP